MSSPSDFVDAPRVDNADNPDSLEAWPDPDHKLSGVRNAARLNAQQNYVLNRSFVALDMDDNPVHPRDLQRVFVPGRVAVGDVVLR